MIKHVYFVKTFFYMNIQKKTFFKALFLMFAEKNTQNSLWYFMLSAAPHWFLVTHLTKGKKKNISFTYLFKVSRKAQTFIGIRNIFFFT